MAQPASDDQEITNSDAAVATIPPPVAAAVAAGAAAASTPTSQPPSTHLHRLWSSSPPPSLSSLLSSITSSIAPSQPSCFSLLPITPAPPNSTATSTCWRARAAVAVLLVVATVVYQHCGVRGGAVVPLLCDCLIVLMCTLGVGGVFHRHFGTRPVLVATRPLECSQAAAERAVVAVVSVVEATQAVLRVAASGSDPLLFATVMGSLYVCSVVGKLASTPTLIFSGLWLVCLAQMVALLAATVASVPKEKTPRSPPAVASADASLRDGGKHSRAVGIGLRHERQHVVVEGTARPRRTRF